MDNNISYTGTTGQQDPSITDTTPYSNADTKDFYLTSSEEEHVVENKQILPQQQEEVQVDETILKQLEEKNYGAILSPLNFNGV